MRTKAPSVLVVFIIDSANSLIVKNFTQKRVLKEILVKVSNSLLNFIDRFFYTKNNKVYKPKKNKVS